ncbi:PBECR2 nuclease fold domain-containing protein [Hungatella hathewayi]|uniref:Phage-Barnase-EndoU-ColicinE5/D-RelE like nuclease 2 domain-containing protein n=1 Tax=Hungatella hathewayi WAL-18680 TaxID=742737 RepID=G5IBN8_9FIRM|nr:PBECR2 nuclease fold domain-containing protein [Hungatella hathewayi]EHI61101.1 hypothetical protein HMPREF9473_00915 [ [Hungatella hathewayi WAL-18680]MBS4986998.1 hypothetical protein [Hungatella hathewayi]
MRTVGRIDRSIYSCVADDIVTDEVIITEERIAHIAERHPGDYERFCQCLKEVVERPDFIVETQKPNTALLLKELAELDGKKFKTILRLMTSREKSDYKNSIITFMKIDEKEWNRLIRNKKIIYKRE